MCVAPSEVLRQCGDERVNVVASRAAAGDGRYLYWRSEVLLSRVSQMRLPNHSGGCQARMRPVRRGREAYATSRLQRLPLPNIRWNRSSAKGNILLR